MKIKKYLNFKYDNIDDYDLQLNESLSGKQVFKSFLKSLTALGKKEIGKNDNMCPQSFLIFYHYDNIEIDKLRPIFNRYTSLRSFLNLVSYDSNNLNLYYGVKNNGMFEYGLFDKEITPFGEFKLSNSVIKWILSLMLKSSFNLKKDLVNLTYNDLILFGRIKDDLTSFNIGFFDEIKNPVINDRIITIGYHGVGKWENGNIDTDNLTKIKDDFNKWVLSKKWSNKILFNISANAFWVNIKIKLK